MTPTAAAVGPAVPERTQGVFAPVPLLTGNTVDVDGVPTPATSARVVITTQTGHDVVVPLEWRFGGWWAPQP